MEPQEPGSPIGPLHDVRVLAIEQYGAGPWASLQLAELGAEVIKIENPSTGGDIGRYVPPFQQDEDSLFFETFNRNKLSVGLDMRSTAGREVFEELVAVSVVVFSNLRGTSVEKLRLRHDDLKDHNPRIVCCSLAGYGNTGPRAEDAGYDYLVQGLAGWMTVTGEPDGPPTKAPLSLVDFGSGFVAAASILAGLHAARRDGRGLDCDVSMHDTAISLLTYLATWQLTKAEAPVRTADSAHPSIVPFQNFRTADGWIVIACPKQRFWESFVTTIGAPELLDDDRFRGFEERRVNRETLIPILQSLLEGRTTQSWLEAFSEADVPAAPINDVRTALDDPQVQARGLIVETDHPRFGRVRSVASPLRAGPPRVEHVRAPHRGEHTRTVLQDLLGNDVDRLRELRRRGAFGATDSTDKDRDA